MLRIVKFTVKTHLLKCSYYIGKHFCLTIPHKPIRRTVKSTIPNKTIFISFFIWPFSTGKKEYSNDDKINKTSSAIESADQMFEIGQYKECFKLLRNYEAEESIEIKWRISRVLYNMAKDPRLDKTSQKKMVLEAFNIINLEKENNYDSYAVQKWYALLLDAKSSHEGIKAKIEQLENVKKHMDLAISLNPNDASLLHILGEWCYQLTKIPWYQRKTVEAFYGTLPNSSYDDALKYFLQAESIQPRFYSVNLLRIGCCYLNLNKPDQAEYYLRLAASYPAKCDDDHQTNKEAAELLNKFKTK